MNYDLTNLAVKMVMPTNELIYDDKGIPSVMVKIPKFKISDVITDGSDATHPAFIVNGVEVPVIYISKYQNRIQDGRAYSLPGEDPAASINFDNARIACESKGPGWHLMTNAEWAVIALWCKKNGFMPYGNNSYGKDSRETVIKAIPSMPLDASNRIQRVATGTGPIEWSHDKTLSGIWDLNGNVWEWMGGYRTVIGEIQILANNDAADLNNPQNETSVKWRAIMPDGSLVAPGTAGTLKWDYVSSRWTLATTITSSSETSRSSTFETIAAASGITAPEILKALALFPADTTGYEGDLFYGNNAATECLACRGGQWAYAAVAGVFAFNSASARSYVGPSIGFRSAYIPNI